MGSYYNGKVIWITGGSSGIGEALAKELSAAGARLILSSRREEELQRVRNACTNPDQVRILPLDLMDVGSLEGKAAAALSHFGSIDMIVHNGGVSQRWDLVQDIDMSVHRTVMEVNYFSYIALTKSLLPHFLERKSGHFVVTSSVMGKIGTPMRAGYAASKHALHGYFDCLRAEVAPFNIKVTLLTPGYIQTQITSHMATTSGKEVSHESSNIKRGYPVDKAARQIVRAVEKGKCESYIGRFGKETLALWLERFTPSLMRKIAVNLIPK